MSGYRSHTRDAFPARGTKSREIVRHLLRPEGLTALQSLELGLTNSKAGLHKVVERLRDLKGWRIVPVTGPLAPGSTRPTFTFHALGVYLPGGRYRELKKLEKTDA